MHPARLFEQARTRVRALERRQWVIGGLSAMMTAIIIVTFLVENRFGYLPRDPIVAYFKSWQDGRTYEDALAVQSEEARLAAEAEAVAAGLDIDADGDGSVQ